MENTRFTEDVDLITDKFDKKTKPSFTSDEDDYWIQFAGIREKDPDLNIRSGQLKISGSGSHFSIGIIDRLIFSANLLERILLRFSSHQSPIL